jgi:hypothetical protein
LRFVFAGWLLAGIGGPFSADAVEAADPVPYEIKPAEQGPKVFRDGQLLTQYLELSGHKPVLYPLIGPGGAAMTRSYPIAATRPGEREDHVHHRSLWFTHGEVNGVDFWAEGDGRGKIIQTDLRTEKTGDGVAIRTENAWQAPTGEKLLSDVRELVFHDVEGTRAIDFDIVLTAGDAPVVFGDTKEGSFGIRVAGTMKVDSEPGGSIVNSEGDQGAAAWGKRASWVDYTGPVDGQIVGVAILNHPASFNYPTRWHVRTYGLFAANPFGVHHFEGGEPTPGVKLEPGESLTLRYRVLMHEGHTSQADIAEHWERYAGL